MESFLSRHWHSIPVAQVAEILQTDLTKGLDLFAVEYRRNRFGPTSLVPKGGRNPCPFSSCNSITG